MTRWAVRRILDGCDVPAPEEPDVPDAPAMRVLILDIETRPNLAYVWGLWEQNVGLNQLVQQVQVICWVAKWLDEPGTTEFRSVHHDGHGAMVRRMWELLNEADAVLHFNGKRFDIPHLNREFLELGLNPPSPYKQIDLLAAVKRAFSFPSNKLAYVSKALGLGGKVQHEGFDMWLKCMAGDEKAWEQMRVYNERDVTLLEDLYHRLKPWIRSHPSFGAMNDRDDVCPGCGSENLKPQGHAFLNTGRYQRFRCEDCGRWSRSTKRSGKTNIVEVAA